MQTNSKNKKGVLYPHSDPLVISFMIADCAVEKILVDDGSSSEILFYGCFRSLPTAPEGLKHALLATDYYSKWVKSMAYVTMGSKEVKNFLWENIICRFGVEESLLMGNGIIHS